MEFEYEKTVDVSAAAVWDALTDPAAMEPHLPGAAGVVASGGENAYRVSMKISMGFLKPTVKADVQLSNVVVGESFSIDVSGNAMGAGVASAAEVSLASDSGETESTRIRMVGTVQTSGLLAKVADSKIESAVTGFLDSYFESVARGAAASS